MSSLDDYLKFLPLEGQTVIQQLRHDAHESISILSGIHWVAHHPNVNPKLAKLIVKELNKVLTSLLTSNYASMSHVKSVASLTLTPDKCYDECFGDWEDYAQIKNMIPLLEIKLGRPVILRPKPDTNIYRPMLWQRLQRDAFSKKSKNIM